MKTKQVEVSEIGNGTKQITFKPIGGHAIEWNFAPNDPDVIPDAKELVAKLLSEEWTLLAVFHPSEYVQMDDFAETLGLKSMLKQTEIHVIIHPGYFILYAKKSMSYGSWGAIEFAYNHAQNKAPIVKIETVDSVKTVQVMPIAGHPFATPLATANATQGGREWLETLRKNKWTPLALFHKSKVHLMATFAYVITTKTSLKQSDFDISATSQTLCIYAKRILTPKEKSIVRFAFDDFKDSSGLN